MEFYSDVMKTLSILELFPCKNNVMFFAVTLLSLPNKHAKVRTKRSGGLPLLPTIKS